MKKLILIVMIALFLSGCEYVPTDNTAETNSTESVETPSNSTEEFFDENGNLIKTKEVVYLPEGEYMISWGHYENGIRNKIVSERYNNQDMLVTVREISYAETGKKNYTKDIKYATDGSYEIVWYYYNGEDLPFKDVVEKYNNKDTLISLRESWKEDSNSFYIAKEYDDNGLLYNYHERKNDQTLVNENYFYHSNGKMSQKTEFFYEADGTEKETISTFYSVDGEMERSEKTYSYISVDGNNVDVIIRYDSEGNFIKKEEQELIPKANGKSTLINRTYLIDGTLENEFITTTYYNEFDKEYYTEQFKNEILEWKEYYTYDDNQNLIKNHIQYFNEFDNLTHEEIQFLGIDGNIEVLVTTIVYFDSYHNYDYRKITYTNNITGETKTNIDYPDSEGNFNEIEKE